MDKKENLQLITSKLQCFGYDSITENTMIRKGGGLSFMYKDDLTVDKIKIDKRPTFELLLLKIKIASHKQPLELICFHLIQNVINF